ncbi:MAG: hypothetical protein ACOYVF_13130 [Candidatus Zixiibacteriota bacterium]
MNKFCLSIFLFLMLLGSARLAAQAPQTMVYQGRMTDIAGNPIADSNTVVFSIYADSVEGFPLWTEVLTVVPDNAGVFTIELGTKSPLTSDLFNGEKRYLGLKVGLDPEMSPRQLLTSGPYTINTADFADNSVTAAKITADAVGNSELANNAVTSANVLDNNLTNTDLLDEPGLAFKVSLPTATFRDLPADTATLDSIIITTPAAGFIHVWAHTNLAIDHVNGTTDEIFLQITPFRDSILANDNGFAMFVLPAELPTQADGWYIHSADFSRPFAVESAGVYTYYFNANVRTGSGDDDNFFNLQITGFYFPSYYGGTPIPSPGELGTGDKQDKNDDITNGE